MVQEQSDTDTEQTAPTDAADEPVAVEAAQSETPTEVEDEPVAVEAAQSETPTETEDEPVADEAAQSETPTETEDEPVAVGAAQPEPLVDIPDSPFPIEAALAARARLQQAQATPNERPALRFVASSDMDGDVPAFLIEQIKRRKGVGGSLNDQQESREVSAA